MKRDSSALYLVNTLKDLYAKKEMSTDKRDETNAMTRKRP
jgi:hypothetical protein